MSFTLPFTAIRIRPLVLLLVLFVSVVLGGVTATWWIGGLWFLGHLLILVGIQTLDQALERSFPPLGLAGLLALPLATWLLLLGKIVTPLYQWRGFLHLDDVPLGAWLHLVALLPLLLGSWIVSLRLIQHLQRRVHRRGQRILWLFGATGVGVLWCLLWQHPETSLTLGISLAVLLVSADIYLETNRTSLTWLLVWLLLLGLITATLVVRQSQRIDLVQHQFISQDIARLGTPDTTRRYHLRFQWDTLSNSTAQQRLPAALLSLEPGQGKQVRKQGRADWVWHRTDGQGFILVGRATGGMRLPLAITSLFFVVALFYVLLLRVGSWAFGLPYQRWALPLFGPSSLRVRIQLAFFGILLVAFLLVAWFTIYFFRAESEFYNDWLEQLLSLYVFLLVIAGTLGILLANSITEPIVRIGQRLGGTRLRDNEPISWPRQDEIGRLVNNYNQMIRELETSATQLAQREREGAWREMAKQVAHEIKNPLTPMKLQLQQLLRLEKEDPERARQWSQMVAQRMIEQIDGLALIATEFSHFARLPEAKATTFELGDLLQSACDLHQTNGSHTSVQFNRQTPESTVLADRDQLLRVANNLIKNAIQA
ncbi:MAG: histidine kinase dimerization/phospho-acceptor domain-containing protein, partial [Bacteroidota bacterium]